jgi:hypothetical protein
VTDLSFLRRRVRAAATPAPTGRPALYPNAVPAPTVAPVAVATDAHTLTTAEPAIRLSRYASGIGTLRITGATDAWVETIDGRGYRAGEAPTFGNRVLLDTDEGTVLVGLRHVRRLRRIALRGTDLTVTTHLGLTVRVPGDADLGIHLVDGHLELRRDTPSSTPLTQAYAIGDLP